MAYVSAKSFQKMRRAVRKETSQLLDHGFYSIAFQPIVETVRSDIFGFEGLLRGPVDSALAAPQKLFHEQGLLQPSLMRRLDLLCLERALRTGRMLARDNLLFLNVHGETLWRLDRIPHGLFDLMDALGIDPHRVVLEISEATEKSHIRAIAKSLVSFRKLGVRVALDDLGARYPWLHHMLWLEPDYLKIDRVFVRGVNRSSGKRRIIEGLSLFADHIGAAVIAEGVETSLELKALTEMDIRFAQGYLFGRAKPAELWCHGGVRTLQQNRPSVRGVIEQPIGRRARAVRGEASS